MPAWANISNRFGFTDSSTQLLKLCAPWLELPTVLYVLPYVHVNRFYHKAEEYKEMNTQVIWIGNYVTTALFRYNLCTYIDMKNYRKITPLLISMYAQFLISWFSFAITILTNLRFHAVGFIPTCIFNGYS